jgi:hypothetical protein
MRKKGQSNPASSRLSCFKLTSAFMTLQTMALYSFGCASIHGQMSIRGDGIAFAVSASWTENFWFFEARTPPIGGDCTKWVSWICSLTSNSRWI